MSSPRQSHWARLHKIGRYLAGAPGLVMRFPWQKTPERVTAFTDSDWAGCVRTARSTSGGIVMIGAHTIKSYSRQQKVVALSSAEAELYAMVAASAESLAVIGYAQDLGVEFEGEVFTDSSAALGIAHRAGIGKVRHLRTQGLWVQEVRATNRLKYLKVLGSKEPADVLTKHVPAELLGRHLEATGMAATGGRAAAAPELHSVESAVFLCEEPHETKMLRFAAMVSYKAIPAVGKGRKVGQRGGGEPKLTFRAACVEGGAGRLLAEPGPRRTEDSKPRVSGPSKAETANRKWEASQRYEATEPAVGYLHAQSQGRYLESEAIAIDKWQKFIVEVKETKRWADVEDSDEGLTTSKQNDAASEYEKTTQENKISKTEYKSVHALDASAPSQQCCADVVHTHSIRAPQAAEQVLKGFYCAFANAMLPDQEAQALVVVQHCER